MPRALVFCIMLISCLVVPVTIASAFKPSGKIVVMRSENVHIITDTTSLLSTMRTGIEPAKTKVIRQIIDWSETNDTVFIQARLEEGFSVWISYMDNGESRNFSIDDYITHLLKADKALIYFPKEKRWVKKLQHKNKKFMEQCSWGTECHYFDQKSGIFFYSTVIRIHYSKFCHHY